MHHITCRAFLVSFLQKRYKNLQKDIKRERERERELAGDADRDVDINVGTHMLLWLEAFRPVTNAKAQVVHQVMLLLYVT